MNPLERQLLIQREAAHLDASAGLRGLGDFGGAIVTGALVVGTVVAAAVGAGVFAGGYVATARGAPSEVGVGIAAAVGAAGGAALIQGLALTRPS